MNNTKRLSQYILKQIKNDWQLYVLILPAVVYLFFLSYIPMCGVQIAFKDFSTHLGIWNSPWVGLKHFIRFVNYPNFWKIIKNTLSITIYSLITFPIPIILALMINEVRSKRYQKIVQMISYAPHFVSTVVVCSMLILFLDRSNGLINHIICSFGGTADDWLSKPSLFSSLYVWSGVWQSAGWNTIIFIATLAGVSPELHEAAKIDGANRFQIIRHVNLPALVPTIITLLIMRFGQVMSLGFEKIYLLQNSLNLDASQVISTYAYEMGIKSGQFSYASAIGLFNTVINIVLLIVVNKICRKVAGVSLW